MIDLYYQTEMPLPDDIDWIARKTKSDTFIVETLLNEFFDWQPESGSWHLKRADLEIAKYHAMQEGGRKGAAKRWSKGSDSPPIDTPMPTKNQEPLTNNQIDIKPVAKATKGTRWSKDNQISEDWIAYCKEKRPDLDYKEVFESFTDYWISVAGAKGVKLDWDATWRTWVRNQRSKISVSKNMDDKSWQFSNQGIEDKARELGVVSMGLSYQQLKEKCLLVMAKKAMQ